MNTPNLWICAALVAFGILFHFITKLAELEKMGKIITPVTYWTEHPYTSLLVVMAAYAAMGVQAGIGELSYSASILTGIACNSLGDKLRAQAESRSEKAINKG